MSSQIGRFRRCFSSLGLLSVLVIIICCYITTDNTTILMPSVRSLSWKRHFYVQDSPIVETPLQNKIVSNGTLVMTSAFTRCNDRQLLLTVWERKYHPESNYFCCLRLENGTIIVTNRTERLRFFSLAKLQVVLLAFELPELLGNYKATVVKLAPKPKAKHGAKRMSMNYNISSVSEAVLVKQCPSDVTMYIQPETPMVPKTYSNITEAYNTKIDQTCLTESERKKELDRKEPFSLAICAKIAFNNLDPHIVIEWVEYHIQMGVSLILVYTHNLNNITRHVLSHYEEEGYVVVYNFDLPMKDILKRKIGDKSRQAWNDEQVVLSDCYSRLRLFKYLAVIDFDEFLVPVEENSFESLIARLQKRNPWASSYTFLMQFHITQWTDTISHNSSNDAVDDINTGSNNSVTYQTRDPKPTDVDKNATNAMKENETSAYVSMTSTTTNRTAKDMSNKLYLYADRFREHTRASMINMKVIHMPGRSHFWAPWTHIPSRKLKPYKNVHVKPAIATISHFRKCRRQWKNNTCFTVKRENQDRIRRFLDDQYRDKILQKKKELFFSIS